MSQFAGYWIDPVGTIYPLQGMVHTQWAAARLHWPNRMDAHNKLLRDGWVRIAGLDDYLMIESERPDLPRQAINSILSDFTVYCVRAFLAGELREIVRTKPIKTLPKF